MSEKYKKIITLLLGIITLVGSFLLEPIMGYSLWIYIFHITNIFSIIFVMINLLKNQIQVKRGIIIYVILQITALISVIADTIIKSLRVPEIYESEYSEYNKKLIIYTIVICVVTMFVYGVISLGLFKSKKIINVITIVVFLIVLAVYLFAYFNHYLSDSNAIKYIIYLFFSFWLWCEYVAYRFNFKFKPRKKKLKSNITLEELKEKADKGQISNDEYKEMKKKIIDSL